MQDKRKIVIDNGSQTLKVGYTGDDKPQFVIPAVYGIWGGYPPPIIGYTLPQFFFEEALQKKGVLKIKRPIQYGFIDNFQVMVKMWHRIFYNQMKIIPQQHSVLLTQNPHNYKQNRQKIIQIMFQCFDFSSVCLSNSSYLSLIESGRTTGIVTDSGYQVTHFVPIYEGIISTQNIMRMHMGGNCVNFYLLKLLKQNKEGVYFNIIVDNIKKQICYLAQDYQQQLKKFKNSKQLHKQYQLPDNQILSVTDERIKCTQVIFKPYLQGKSMYGFHQHLIQTLDKFKQLKELQVQLLKNIVLAGGNTLIKGFPERLKIQVQRLLPKNAKFNIIAPSQRIYSGWIGGSILASINQFQSQYQWITKEQYNEAGSQIVHKKCPA